MRRALTLLCLGAVAASGLALSGPATAAPADQASSTAATAVPDELVIGYVAGASETERGRARARAGAQRQEQVVAAAADRTEVELVRLPAGRDRDAAIAELESDPAVAYAEPNWIYTRQITDPYFTSTDPATDLWGMYGDTSKPANAFGSSAAEAWTAGSTGSAGVYVGVIDEGIQFAHPDLVGQVGNPKELTGLPGVDDDGNGFVDDVHGWDFANGDNSVYDGGTKGNLDDHGTHVAGTIGAKADGKGVVGVNHEITMISGKFLGRRGGTLADAVQAVDYFTDLKKNRGLNIVATNNSWGGGGYSDALFAAITRANTAGILFVAAAGNSGTDNDASPSYPSSYAVDNVIAVAAIDRTGALASFSQYGKASVDLGAPGVDVWSTTAPNGYSRYSGTSMATPHVTGAAALYAAARSGTSAASIKTALLSTAVMTPSLCGRTSTNGRLDIAAALVGSPQTAACSAPPTGPSAGTPSVTVTKGTKSGAFTPVTASWSGFEGDTVDVSRSGATFIEGTPGTLTESWRGTGEVKYTVCERVANPVCVSASVVI